MANVIFSYDNDDLENQLESYSDTVKICLACNRKFIPYGKRPTRLKFCNRVHYCICPVCGSEFQIDLSAGINCVKKACSRECSNKLKKSSMESTMKEKYGVTNPGQMKDHQSKVSQTCMEKYGVESYSQSEDFKNKCSKTWSNKSKEELDERLQKSIITNQIRYGVDNGSQAAHAKEKQIQTNRERYGVDWYRQTDECEQRIRSTTKQRYGNEVYFRTKDCKNKIHEISLSKYGVDHFTQSDVYKQHMSKSNIDRWGVSCVFQRPDIRKKACSRTSNLEIRLHNMLNNYDIAYETEYLLHNGTYSHHFDVFIPNYKLLIDVDGVYYHAYTEDPDGLRSRDDYDDVRLYCVPKGYIYFVLIESDFERGLRRLQKVLQLIDKNLFDYDSELFQWCRSIEFPYYNYTKAYMNKQFNRLCKYTFETYVPSCEIGISIIQQFHKSIFDCRVNGYVSIKEAWNDDNLLKKTIANRLIYQNTVNPSKILSGFNISKIAPKVSVFNPVLAKYLIQKYLSEFTTIFDPFSGFSGRLLGALSCNKKYIGSDIREISIKESNEILNFLNNSTSSVSVADVYDSFGEYECLLTCPPYNDKEIYIQNQVNLSEDDWITLCLNHFKCKKYVFVVGNTSKYKDQIVDEIKCKSHFRKNSEYIVVIS